MNNYINHIAYVIDKSSSMSQLSNDVIKVFDNQIKRLAKRSQELDQETRVSVYLFSDQTECIIYDKDVLRLPSLKNLYAAYGNTALRDAAYKAITDLKQTPELYGEHSFLVYVITDGEENCSRKVNPAALNACLKGLPDHWTVAALVPDQTGVHEVKTAGFPADNISVWKTDSSGMEEVGERMFKATDNFMVNRAKGVRGTKSLFALDTKNINKKVVKANLGALSSEKFKVLPVRKNDDGKSIRDFVEAKTKKKYKTGSAYYQLTKKEIIQHHKGLCLKEKDTGKIYTGDSVRDLLSLPDFEVKVEPAAHPQFVFFVQSTSTNRKLVGDTELVVLNGV